MALTKGLNSYVNVLEASSYFDNRLDVAAWTDASESQKEQSLVTASLLLDSFYWKGQVASELQELAFPRTGDKYFDPFLGMDVILDESVVPLRITRACMELAYHLLNNDGLLDDTGEVKALQIAGIKIDAPRAANKVPDNVRAMIRPLLNSVSVNRSWWRAN